MDTGGIINNMAHDFHEFSMRLTDNARDSLQASERIARNLGSAYVGTEHLLLGIVREGDGLGARILNDNGLTEPMLSRMVVSA